jgi:hypothetical protein
LTASKPSAIDLDALRTSETEGLLSQLVTSRARLQQLAQISAEMGDIRGAVAVETAICTNLQLVARLLGQLVVHHDVRHTSVLISQDYLKLRAALVAALRPFPDAARAVGAALHKLEVEAAEEIKAHARPSDATRKIVEIDHVPPLLAPPPFPPLPPIPPPPC